MLLNHLFWALYLHRLQWWPEISIIILSIRVQNTPLEEVALTSHCSNLETSTPKYHHHHHHHHRATEPRCSNPNNTPGPRCSLRLQGFISIPLRMWEREGKIFVPISNSVCNHECAIRNLHPQTMVPVKGEIVICILICCVSSVTLRSEGRGIYKAWLIVIVINCPDFCALQSGLALRYFQYLNMWVLAK